MASELLHLSTVVRSPLVDRAGDRIGRVEDCIVRPGYQAHPPVTGLIARIGRRELYVPIERVAEIRPRRVLLEGETLNLSRFDRRPGELLLARDLSSRHL